MSSIEIVRLQHGDSLLINNKTKLFQRDSSFYIADILGEKIIYRFNREGRFLNKIGKKRKGPEEYPNMLDVTVGKNNNIYILLTPYLIFTRYDQNGAFKEKKGLKSLEMTFADQGMAFGYMQAIPNALISCGWTTPSTSPIHYACPKEP